MTGSTTKCRIDSCYLVIKNWQYLVSAPYADTFFVRWSNDKYDGMRIHRYRLAKMLADRLGGRVVEFNPLNGRVVQ